ncbi:hypothetical protein GGF32_003825 [Allomyces javanicus]|nr:hypothetical protein GGF32_003825 [Allomyces javanicus]
MPESMTVLEYRAPVMLSWTFSYACKPKHWIQDLVHRITSTPKFYVTLQDSAVEPGHIYFACTSTGAEGRNPLTDKPWIDVYIDAVEDRDSPATPDEDSVWFLSSRNAPKRVYDVTDFIQHLRVHDDSVMLYEVLPLIYESLGVPCIPLSDVVMTVTDGIETRILHFFDQLSVLEHTSRDGIRTVVGTSIGSFTAFLFALGMTPDEMQDTFAVLDTSMLTVDHATLTTDVFTKYGIESGEYFAAYLCDILLCRGMDPEITLDAFWSATGIHFAACAVDIMDCQAHLLDHIRFPDMTVVDAIVASCAIPIFVQPVRYRDRILVDGGVQCKLPLDLAVGVLGIPTTEILASRLKSVSQVPAITNVVEYVRRLLQAMTHRPPVAETRIVDMDCHGYESMNFGYSAADKAGMQGTMKAPSVHDFVEDARQIEARKRAAYETVLAKLYHELVTYRQGNVRSQFFVYTVPLIHPTEPEYTVKECVRFIKQDVKAKGFCVRVLSPGNKVYVSWHPDDIPAPSRDTPSTLPDHR